jgi:hypothetical protein
MSSVCLWFCLGGCHEYIDGDEVVGLGSINKEGSGRLRLVASQQKVRSMFGCAARNRRMFDAGLLISSWLMLARSLAIMNCLSVGG